MVSDVTSLEEGCDRADLAGPARRAFLGLAKAWSLTDEEQVKLLGLSSRSSLRRWRSGDVAILRWETLERISYLLGIFKAINVLLPVPQRADAWLRAPNKSPLFSGRSALDRMTSGNLSDLCVVRRYLDAECNEGME